MIITGVIVLVKGLTNSLDDSYSYCYEHVHF